MDPSSQHQQGQEYQSWQSQSQQGQEYQAWHLQSQPQSYDPSAYNYHHHHHQPYYYDSYYYQQQYPNGYAYTPDQSNAHHPRPQHAPPIHPPGVPAADVAVPGQENVYQQPPPPPQQPGSGDISAPATYLTPGLQQGHRWYPQLDAYGPVVGGPGLASGPGPRPFGLPPPAARPSHNFGGKRGGKPSRGGGRGKSLRGKGRNQPGRGGSRLLSSSNMDASIGKNTNHSSGQEAGPSTNTPAKEANSNGPLQVTASIQKNAASRCELCKVDCTSMEVLEQHKLGKRHQKNLKKLEPLKNFNVPPISESQDGKKVADDSNSVPTLQTEIHVEESKPNLSENLPSETVTGSTEQKDEVGNPNAVVPVEAKPDLHANKRRAANQFSNQRRGSKRNMRGGSGRGGKRMRTSDAPRPERGPSKPKVVIPLVCDLCNVKCDTQEVLDRHLSGKKHMSKRKHFEVHQAMYGPIGLQALYPPNPVTQTLLHSQGHQQALYVPQGPDSSAAAASLPAPTQNAVS